MVYAFADQGDMLQRPMSEIYENLRDYFVATVDEKLVGCCSLHISWEDLAEIKALAVAPEWQRKGIGANLVQQCLKEAEELGLPTVFALTLKPKFFETLSFVQEDIAKLPRKVWGECYRCVKFPNCDEVAVLYYFKNYQFRRTNGDLMHRW
jgi:amino-acid N-acetyltransferase